MKRTALFLAGILAISSLSGCGAKNSESDSSEPFEGKYVVTADYVKENLDDIIVVDARGEDEAKKGTVKGAVATTWQYLATCEDGEAGDANWGCILCAIGYAEADFDIDKVDVDLESEKGIVEVCRNGSGIPFSEEKASEVLSEDDIYINVNLNQGESSAKAWGCDLTYDYIKINADYRS